MECSPTVAEAVCIVDRAILITDQSQQRSSIALEYLAGLKRKVAAAAGDDPTQTLPGLWQYAGKTTRRGGADAWEVVHRNGPDQSGAVIQGR